MTAEKALAVLAADQKRTVKTLRDDAWHYADAASVVDYGALECRLVRLLDHRFEELPMDGDDPLAAFEAGAAREAEDDGIRERLADLRRFLEANRTIRDAETLLHLCGRRDALLVDERGRQAWFLEQLGKGRLPVRAHP